MRLLREDGYIAMDRYGTITLLEKGAKIADQIYERHTIISRMLMELGVPEEIAKEDACKVEHALSQESFDRIKEHFMKRGGNVEIENKNI
ncbi:Iron dependent repressor [gut metagenome]|uniref:Iron dependent repressor n=1 Tax=gut metagenome TaxID=749906 RepID=J9GD01_9ZZZZ